jgi:hypothetical protein
VTNSHATLMIHYMCLCKKKKKKKQTKRVVTDVVWVLAFQGDAFRGTDESMGSTNRENFLEILDLVV